jgi:hypothetical protein
MPHIAAAAVLTFSNKRFDTAKTHLCHLRLRIVAAQIDRESSLEVIW